LETKTDITRSQPLYHKLESEIKLNVASMLGINVFEICYNVYMG